MMRNEDQMYSHVGDGMIKIVQELDDVSAPILYWLHDCVVFLGNLTTVQSNVGIETGLKSIH